MRPKVRHVAVMTKNREKMVEFYQKVFGLEPKRGFGGGPEPSTEKVASEKSVTAGKVNELSLMR